MTNRISKLLSDFFEGTTSPKEEAELERLIKEAGSIPDALRDDCEAFLLCRQAAGVEVPEGLRERLEAAIDSRAKEEFAAKAKSRLSIRAIASVAAAAAVVIAFLIPALRPATQQTPEDKQTIAQAVGERIADEQPVISEVAEAAISDAASQTEPAKQSIQALKPTGEAKRGAAPTNVTPTRVVDDPQEAAMYIAKALGKLSESRQTADARLSECNNQLERASRLLNAVSSRITADENTPV